MPHDSPLLFVVSGPSGSGKGTLLSHLAEQMPDMVRVQTYTTRQRRPIETDDDYGFITQEAFDKMAASGELFEYTRTYEDYCYGSPRKLVDCSEDKDYLVELEVKGMLRMKSMSQRRVVSIFILPSSIQVLEERIRARHLEENFAARISKAFDQVSYAYAYDYLIVNDEKDRFLSMAEGIVRAERDRRAGAEFMRKNLASFLHT